MKKNLFLLIVIFKITLTSYVKANNIHEINPLLPIEGISHTTITALAKDPFGFIWVGTPNGLNRYDGYSVELFKSYPDKPSIINNNHITALHTTSNNKLWIGTNAGISCIDLITFESLKGDKKYFLDSLGSLNISVIKSSPDESKLFIGTRENGFFILDFKNNSLKNFAPSQLSDVLKSDYIHTLFYDADHKQLFFSTSNTAGSLNLSNEEIKDYFSFKNSENIRNTSITSFYRQKNKLFFTTWDKGLFELNLAGKIIRAISLPEKDETRIITTTLNTGDLLFYGLRNGLLVKQGEKYKKISLLDEYQINDVCRVGKNHFLIGTQNHSCFIIDLSNNPFHHLTTEQINLDKRKHIQIRSVHQLNENQMVIGTTQGLYLWNQAPNNVHQEKIPEILKDINISSIHFTDGFIWVGTDGYGLFKLSGDFKILRRYTHIENNPASLSNDYIYALTADKKGNLYIGAWSEGNNPGGVDVLNIKSDSLFNIRISQHDNIILSLFCDDKDNIWAGTKDKGLIKLSKSFNKTEYSKKQYINQVKNPKSLSSNTITAINQLNNGDIIVGTAGMGFDILDPDNAIIKHYDVRNGLPNDFITGIIKDPNEDFWITTMNGLIRYETKKDRIQTYHEVNGLLSDNFVQGSAYISNNKMYFGTNRGLLYFPYQEIKNNHNIEGLTIAGVSINGIEIDLTEHKLLKKAPYVTDSLILPHNKNNISIHCCIDPVILSKSTTYKYKLEGVDNEWQTLPSNSNIITYNNLAGGDHLLSIKTNNEAFSKDLFIQIKLPFYNQKWFRFLIILLICILIFILLKLRRKSHENEKSFLIEKSREILFDEKRQFKTLIDNIPDLIYIKNTDHQYVIVNKQMTKTLGIKNTNDLIGRTDVDFYPKELAELYKKDENAILSEGKHIISKDEIGLDEKGNTRYISTTKVPLRNSKDEIVGLLGIGRDITKQKIAEQKLIEHSDNLQEINTLLEERQEEIQQQSDELLEQRNRINKEKERLQTLIDSMPDVIYFKDRYANFITANKTLLRIMGVDALEDVQGKSDLDFFDAELAEKFMADDLSIIKSGTPLINKEEPGIDEHGKRIVRSTTKIPLRDKNGLVTGLIGIGRDISSQKLAETKLQEQANNLKEINVLLEERQEEIEHQSHQLSEQSNKLQKEHNQLRTLIDALPEVIYFKDKEARFITANQKLVNIMKAGSIENLTGKTDHDFYDKELADEFYEDDMKIIREGLPILNKKERGFDIEGNERYIETSKIPVKDKKGKVTGLIGIGKDITEKVEADDKLREQADNLSEVNVLLEERQEEIYQQSEELKEKQLLLTKERNQLRTLIDTMPDVIYFKNSRAEFITANETLIQIMKAKNQEGIAGKTDFDFYEEDLARKFYEDDMQVIKSGTAIINKEETGYDLSGMKRIMSTTKVPLKDRQNKVIGLVGIGRDITKQKQAERKLIQQADDLKEINVLLEERQEEIQQQAEELNATAESLREANTELEKLNKTKNKFFSIIAHDLKNPFHAIFGFSELLLQNQTELDPQREKELIELIKSSSETAYNLLENLLQWARTQTDRIKYNPERTDVIELIENNISFAELSLTKKNLKLNKQLQQNTFAYIDKNMINTVIRNLLSNAIKFTEKGGEITIEAFAKKEQTIIKIQDNGIGIPEENLKRLFRIDQYFTTEGTSGESGTGLGLIVCKEFVEKNHGSMKIQSKLDFGTVFTISLPSEEF